MSFPQINFKAMHTEVDPALRDLLEVKLQSLERFIGDETDVKCDVEFDKVTSSQSGKIYRIKVNLWLHGKTYHVDATEDSFELALDEVRSELDKELRRANDKRGSLVKRGGRAIKNMMKFGSK
ncbi:MAG: ribosomal subunit interface protein [Candidatus Azotimanducaceae bacterium]|jgi:ribosomal subunit interface protein